MLIKIRKIIKPAFLRKFMRNEKGTILIEFAFTFPIILLAMMAGFEVFRLLMMERKTNLTVNAMTNLISQNQFLADTGIQNAFDAVDHIMKPFALTNGQVIISYVTGGAGASTINVQCNGTSNAAYTSKIGTTGQNAQLGSIPGDFSLNDGETVVISEVYMDYSPLFFSLGGVLQSTLFAPREIYHISVQKPRFGDIIFTNGCPV